MTLHVSSWIDLYPGLGRDDGKGPCTDAGDDSPKMHPIFDYIHSLHEPCIINGLSFRVFDMHSVAQ